MPVSVEPPEDHEALRESVLSSVGEEFGEALTLSAAFPVRTADLRALAGGALRLSSEDRWQCLVGVEEPAAAVDLIRGPDGYVVVSVNYGTLAARFNDAVQLADEALADGDYALSEIDIPGLHMTVARFVERARQQELLIPVLPLISDATTVEPMRIYEAGELVRELQGVAEVAVTASWE